MNLLRSLRFQILIIALLPIMLIDAILTIRHIENSITQAEQLLRSNGEITARQIANAAEFNLFSGDYARLQHLLEQSTNKNDIVYSFVYDHRGNTIAESVGENFDPLNTSSLIYFRQPVKTEALGSSDIFDPAQQSETEMEHTLGWVHIYITRENLQRQKSTIIREAFVYFLVSLLLAVVLTAIISRKVTRPIFILLDYLKKTEAGQLGVTIKSITNNELGELQKGFNSMSQSLLANRQQLNQKIETATQELKNAVSNLEYKNQELSNARDEAQKAIATKSQFLANISHEIRTPINGITGFANLLKRSEPNPNQRRYIDIINQSALDLSGIVNEVLDFSKLESDKVQVIVSQFDLHNLVESARDSLFTEAMDKQIDLFLTIYSDTPRLVLGDKLKVKQILVNLISNAIKFTDRGFVDITIQVDDFDQERVIIRFKIRDSGIGISKEDQKQLFKAFNQIDSESNRRYAGTGLGLVISKNLARLMSGDIEIDSVSGYGSLFSLVLPFGIADEPLYEPDQGQPLTGLLIGFEQHALHEIQSLFDRAGFDSEGILIDKTSYPEMIKASIRRNLNYLDFIVLDLRHVPSAALDYFELELFRKKRVIVMHYDFERVDRRFREYEFISVIITSVDLQQLMLHQDAGASAEAPVTGLKPEQQHTVLVVDDNRVNLMLASELARSWGHKTYQAQNAQEALRLFEQHEFDLILLDIQMPNIDGVDLMHMMREKKPGLKTPIVATTANLQESERRRLLSLGFDAFCGKPLAESRFKALLDGTSSSEPLPLESERESEVPLQSINLELTLTLCAQNQGLAKEQFSMLQEEIPEYIEQLEIVKRTSARHELFQIIHKLQGITRYAGLPILKNLLEEFSLQRDDPALDVFQWVTPIVKELAVIHDALGNCIEQIAAAESNSR